MAFRLGECLLLNVLKRRNMSQSEFARRMNVSRQYIHRLATNQKVMSLEFAINACYVLDCDILDLYVIETTGRQE